MTGSVLLCTDLDRTLIPNGNEPESPGARERLRAVVEREEVTLAFVTGRDRMLVEAVMDEWDLPAPDYVIGDVGSTIYEMTAGTWHIWLDWQRELRRDWGPGARDALARAFDAREELVPQEGQNQGPFKISYHAPAEEGPWLSELRDLLEIAPDTQLVWSRDETRNTGLLDVLPLRGSKLGAIRFLRQKTGIPLDRTVFAGDSGNDFIVLTSEIPSVLVANAAEDLKRRVAERSAANGHAGALYLARGGFRGMNGNYSAGILEGLVHYLPETAAWI